MKDPQGPSKKERQTHDLDVSSPLMPSEEREREERRRKRQGQQGPGSARRLRVRQRHDVEVERERQRQQGTEVAREREVRDCGRKLVLAH